MPDILLTNLFKRVVKYTENVSYMEFHLYFVESKHIGSAFELFTRRRTIFVNFILR